MRTDINELARRLLQLTTSPVDFPLPENNSGEDEKLPEFDRLPKPGKRCRWTGLTRSGVNELILGPNPPVESVVLRKKGATRGVRLIHIPSLLAYLHEEMARQMEQRRIAESETTATKGGHHA